MTERKPTGRVIEGTVAAQASGASVAVNRPPTEGVPVEAPAGDGPATPIQVPLPFFFREVTHNRVTPVRQGDQIVLNMVALIERVHEGGTWPEGVARFQGVGRIDAPQTPIGPVSRNYRFDIPARTLEEAWANFDDASGRGSEQAKQQLRDEIAAALRAQASQIAVPTPAQASRILGADGRPAGG